MAILCVDQQVVGHDEQFEPLFYPRSNPLVSHAQIPSTIRVRYLWLSYFARDRGSCHDYGHLWVQFAASVHIGKFMNASSGPKAVMLDSFVEAIDVATTVVAAAGDGT